MHGKILDQILYKNIQTFKVVIQPYSQIEVYVKRYFFLRKTDWSGAGHLAYLAY